MPHPTREQLEAVQQSYLVSRRELEVIVYNLDLNIVAMRAANAVIVGAGRTIPQKRIEQLAELETLVSRYRAALL